MTEVRFHGSPGHESFSGSDRTNLPERVEAGTDYHDVRVHYRLAAALSRVQHEQPGQDGDPGPDRDGGPKRRR